MPAALVASGVWFCYLLDAVSFQLETKPRFEIRAVSLIADWMFSCARVLFTCDKRNYDSDESQTTSRRRQQAAMSGAVAVFRPNA